MAVGIANAHCAGRRRTSVCDGARSGQHGHVEAQVDGPLTGVVQTLDAIGLGVESHQLGMLLNHQNKLGLAVKMIKTASVELDHEVDGAASVLGLHGPPALRIIAVALDVHDAVEVTIGHVDENLNAILETVDGHLRSREIAHDGSGGNWRAADLGVTSVTLDTCAFSFVVDWLARCTISIGTARFSHANISASVVPQFAIFHGEAVRVVATRHAKSGTFVEMSSLANANPCVRIVNKTS